MVGAMATQHKPRILCVDDEPLLLEGIQAALRRRFEVVVAGSGAQALQILSEGAPFAVVVSDFQMPGMDGAELLSCVRIRSPQTVRVLLTGQASFEGAIRAVNSGHIFRFLTKPCPMSDLAAALDDAVEQSRLITADRELLEAKLATMTGALLQSERLASLGTLAGAIGHELVNVLTPLGCAVDFITDRAAREQPPDPEDLQTLRRVRDHLSTHARHLLDLGRPVKPGSDRADLNATAAETVAMLRTAGLFLRVEVRLDLPPDPLAVTLDRTRVEQVLLNLIKNGVDAMSAISDRETLLVVSVRRESGVAVCRLTDNGCGIEADKLSTIFEPYYTTKPPDRGTGLGLFVVKQIIESAGGSITVRSELGRGTTFELRLPTA